MPLMTITSPGTYFIDTDMTQSDPTDDAIRVAAGVNFVTIVLRGARIVGAGGPGSNNCGINVLNSAAVTILGQGGSIRGFTYGILGQNNFQGRVTGVFVQDAYFRGIRWDGDDSLIAENDIRNITGATFTPDAFCMGIEVNGISSSSQVPKVLRNSIQNVAGVGAGESVGISVTDKGMGATVAHNVVKNTDATPRPGSFGLWVGGASDVAAVHNHFEGYLNGATYSSGTAGRIDHNSYRNVTNPQVVPSASVTVGVHDN